MAKKNITADYTIWTGTSKKDKVFIDYADYVQVSMGAGNDSIYDYLGYYTTINAGSGNDTIKLECGVGSSVNAGSGNDRISLYGGYSNVITVKGGKGNDKIYSNGYSVLHQYAAGDGNDKIFNWSANDTISITGGTYTKKISGDDVILTVGKGKITLVGAKDKVLNIDGTLAGGKNISNETSYKKITGTSYADTITNSGDYVTISGGKGNDKISNEYGNYASIVAGSGKDSIYNRSYSTTINGGSGNDTITNFNAALSSVNGSSGNDLIKLDGDLAYAAANVTVKGGTGKDTISISGSAHSNLICYAKGDGNDIIYGFGSTDTLKITGAKYTRSTVGNDVVVKVGTGKITLKDAANTSINIQGTLKGGGSTSTISPETIPSSDDIHGTSGHEYLSNAYPHKSGINIFGYAGNDTIYNRGNNVYISGGDGNDSIKSENSTSNVTVYGGDGHDRITVSGSDALIYGENGDDYISNGGSNAKIYGDAGNDYIYSYDSRNSIYGGADNDSIYVNGNTNGFVDSGSGNDTIKAWYGDNLSLKGGYGNDLVSVYGGSYVVAYNYGDGDDTIVGFNDNDTLNISGSYTRSTVGNDVVFNVGNGSITLKNTAKTTINIDTSYFASNDALWGNEDSDDFIHSSGSANDFTGGFDNNDALTLDSIDFTASRSQMNSAVTLHDFTATTFHINDDTYKISGSTFKKK